MVKKVCQCKYLRSIITGKYEQDINIRIAMTSKLYMALIKKEISIIVKLSIYKSVYLPTLLHGKEPRVLNKRLKYKMQAAEVKYLRRPTGNTILDTVRIDTIREILKPKSVWLHIEMVQLRWSGHIYREYISTRTLGSKNYRQEEEEDHRSSRVHSVKSVKYWEK